MAKAMLNDLLWVEKYRPKRIADVILPRQLADTFSAIVDGGDVPNMIFAGGAGTGKTTVAKALAHELGCDWLLINGSEEGGIDTLRGRIKSFATTVSLDGNRKVIILDEADYLNPNSTQPALRGFIEECSANCRFILTCNYAAKIIEPLHSRCALHDFNPPKAEEPELTARFLKRLATILAEEGVAFEAEAIAALVLRHAPDWRRILTEAQKLSVTDALVTGDLSETDAEAYIALVETIARKDFSAARKWVAENMDTNAALAFRRFYDALATRATPESLPHVVLALAEYQYKAAFVADQQLNFMAAITEIMVNENVGFG